MSTTEFTSLPLAAPLLEALAALNYSEATPIQLASLPPILAGKDIIGQAQTGSGKTAAFALGILQKLDPKLFQVQALVLCPTRELADQVAQEIRQLARCMTNIKVLTLCGGVPIGPQIASLKFGAHIVVGTPGRIEDHLRKTSLVAATIKTLVLDEADRMLDMGFHASITTIVEQLPTPRQSLLFSATYPDAIEAIAAEVLHEPVLVQIAAAENTLRITQQFYKVRDNDERLLAARLVLAKYQPTSTVIFCNTRRDVDAVCAAMRANRVSALALHGELDQRERDQTLIRFANGSATVLVATDVAARGLDIADLALVINYHIALDSEVHTHRIGRTGRAGNKGLAVSLFSDKEQRKIAQIDADVDPLVDFLELPPLAMLERSLPQAANVTLKIDGGKKQKLRAGDIVGALTAGGVVSGDELGKIVIADNWSYVAVAKNSAKVALKQLSEGKLKGRSFRVRKL